MNTILSAIELQKTKRGCYHFVVTVRCVGGGDAWDVREILTAGELASYSSFKRAMLRRAGLMYVDSLYEGRGGAAVWVDDVQRLLGHQVREVNRA